MKSYVLATFLVLNLFVPTAFASDDGQTQPRLTYGEILSPNSSSDIISTTNGTGNLKGIQCKFANGSRANVNIYVNGGSAQTLVLDPGYFPFDPYDGNFSGWIPLNVRFTSSIRVQLQKPPSSGTGWILCVVSWGLD